MEKLIKELLSCKFKDIDINGLYEVLNATENLEVATSLILGIYEFPKIHYETRFGNNTFKVHYFDPIRQKVCGMSTDTVVRYYSSPKQGYLSNNDYSIKPTGAYPYKKEFKTPPIICSLKEWEVHGQSWVMLSTENNFPAWKKKTAQWSNYDKHKDFILRTSLNQLKNLDIVLCFSGLDIKICLDVILDDYVTPKIPEHIKVFEKVGTYHSFDRVSGIVTYLVPEKNFRYYHSTEDADANSNNYSKHYNSNYTVRREYITYSERYVPLVNAKSFEI